MEPYGNHDPGLCEWIDLYFNLLPLLQSSLEPLVQSDVGGRLSLTMSHLLSGPRLLCIICVFVGKLQSSVLALCVGSFPQFQRCLAVLSVDQLSFHFLGDLSIYVL